MRKILTIIALAVVFGVLAVITTRNSEKPLRTALKWVLTLLVSLFMGWYVWPLTDVPGQSTFSAIGLTLFCGFVLYLTWRMEIGEVLASPFSSLFDGGNIQPELRPLYSIAVARQKRGQYPEAIAEVERQLERFPNDFEGQMLLAQIQAENLHDLLAAGASIQRFCAQPGQTPGHIAFALNSLADWQLQHAADAPAARRTLEQVIALLPETEYARTAAQRIAHLGSPELRVRGEEPKKFALPESAGRIGLVKPAQSFAPAEQDPAQVAGELVKHLESFPLDAEAREQLAAIYVDHYHRLDLAQDQFEQLMQQPDRPLKLLARWLNMLADLQVRAGADYETVKQTLERIVALDPSHPAAENARKRINLLKFGLKSKASAPAVKLGTYEQNLGLTQAKRPRGDSA